MALITTYEYGSDGKLLKAEQKRAADEPLEFTYSWLHIPSGKRGTRVAKFMNEYEFMNALNLWNAADDDWKYWS